MKPCRDSACRQSYLARNPAASLPPEYYSHIIIFTEKSQCCPPYWKMGLLALPLASAGVLKGCCNEECSPHRMWEDGSSICSHSCYGVATAAAGMNAHLELHTMWEESLAPDGLDGTRGGAAEMEALKRNQWGLCCSGPSVICLEGCGAEGATNPELYLHL